MVNTYRLFIMMGKRFFLSKLIFFFVFFNIYAKPDLIVDTEDLLIEAGLDGGYHLWIRKKPDIESVLITESSADPAKRSHSYALRNPSYHPANGDEKRILNGEFLDTSKDLYSLIDSTPEKYDKFGEAFHIFIPFVVIYGYPWSRLGEIQVVNGTFLNIRSFTKPYADYSGSYYDNPFEMVIVQKSFEGPPEETIMPQTIEELEEIADKGGGQSFLSPGEEDILDKLDQIIKTTGGASLDLVLAIDTTGSMKNDIAYVKQELVAAVSKYMEQFNTIRVGILYYRDYFEEYLVKLFPFSSDLKTIQNYINRAKVHGGTDVPEAVYEALYEGIHKYDWSSESRLIILIGDAPPHPRPRGKITEDMVFMDAELNNIIIHTIILPQ